jgi:ribosomal-protein-serine acetyltransferase
VSKRPPNALRHVTIADLRSILGELNEFWDGRDTAFLHQALYVHEFGETSVLAERKGRINGYLLGFVGQDSTGYIHAVAVRTGARGEGLARRMYERFEELVAARGAYRLKAITSPENTRSRTFHEALGFAVEEVEDYSPSGGTRLVFGKTLDEPVAGSGREVDLGDGVRMRPMQLEDTVELHRAIETNRAHIGRWLPFAEQPSERTEAHVRRSVRDFQAGRGLAMVVLDRGRLIGAVSFVDTSREHSSTQIGYWLAREAGGRGIMTRAVAAMIAEAFGPWGFRRVEIRVAAGNARSRAIAERLGFREEGLLRAGHTVGGATHDEVVYGLLAEDPPPEPTKAWRSG